MTGSEWRGGKGRRAGREDMENWVFCPHWHGEKSSYNFHLNYSQLQEILAKLKEYSKINGLYSVFKYHSFNFQWHSTTPWDFLTTGLKSNFPIFVNNVLLIWLWTMKSRDLLKDSQEVNIWAENKLYVKYSWSLLLKLSRLDLVY